MTLRISGFFRDAFPHVIALLDDAVALVAALDEPADQNPIAAVGGADARLWGPPPGGYGSGILPLIEQRSWRTDEDLAEVYLAWSGFAYGRHRHGEAAPEAMRRRFAAIEVAVKNQDNREHDIFDSDDYLQDHGGMVAAVRALTGAAPKAWFGDSADPANPQGALACRGSGTGRAQPRASTPAGSTPCAATATRAPSSWPPRSTTCSATTPRPTSSRTGCTSGSPRRTSATRRCASSSQQSNPWALRSIAERLLEAADREHVGGHRRRPAHADRAPCSKPRAGRSATE